MIKLLFNTLSILKKKHGKAAEMIKAAINHVLDDVCTQTDCINVQTFAQINITFLKYFLVYYRNSSYICSRKKIPTSERWLSLI